MTELNMPWTELLGSPLVWLLGCAVFLLLVGMPPLWLYLHHRRRGRELLHLERMQAIQAGVPVALGRPDRALDDARKMQDRRHGRASAVAFWVGGAVPLTCVVAAGLVSEQPDGNFGMSLAAWIAAMVLGLGGIICATVLMALDGGHRHWVRRMIRAKTARAEQAAEQAHAKGTRAEQARPAEKTRPAEKPFRPEPPRDLGFAAWLESLAHRMQAR
jgi:hypothetical protein